MKIKLLGIDLAKNVFQLCALNQANKVLFHRAVLRTQLQGELRRPGGELRVTSICPHSKCPIYAGHPTHMVCVGVLDRLLRPVP